MSSSGNGSAVGVSGDAAAVGRAAGDAGAGNSIRAQSSKFRFREYLRRRRAAGGADASHPLSPAPGDASVEDPNSPRRTRRSRPFKTLFREFWAMVAGHRLTIAACVCTVTISALVGLAAPASTKIALDYILTDNPGPKGLPEWVPTHDRQQLLWLLGSALMTLTLVSVTVGVWGRYQMTRMTQLLRASMRRRVFNHAVRLPLHRVYQIKSGGAASILREDAGQSADLLFSLLYNPWRGIVQLVGTLVILASTDWLLLLGAALLIPAAWFTQKAWIARIRPVHRAVRSTRQSIDAHSTEAFGGMRIVRGFVRHKSEAARFIRNNHLMSRQEVLVWWWSRVIEIIWQILLPAGSVAVLIYGGYRVVAGTLTLGDVMMFSAYLLMLLGPLEALSASATSIQAELASLDRVLDLLTEPVEFQSAMPAVDAGVLIASDAARRGAARTGASVDSARARGHVRFEGVGFRYPGGEEMVLRGVDLDVPPGSTVALVGPSGAGKTTLCNLVARFYDPTEGRITLDGEDIRNIDVDSYRRLLGIVEQDVFLFDGTVAENIGYARRGVGRDQIAEAARVAHAAAFIERLERGYETLIGERGVRLSGGQKQRIAIARALLADPRMLILDEATSNLDSESEALIQESLRALMRNRTCFVIAHRLSTIRHADLIVVLENGRIAERGTHAELSAREGRYWQMLRAQYARRAEKEDEWAVPNPAAPSTFGSLPASPGVAGP